jgi:LacI family transcriptional regulator
MVTSEQVARLAGVSRATVSRALNGSAYVSEETKKRIREAIASLGYEPNVVAQNLARQRSRVIALGPFFEDSGLLAQLEPTGHYYHLGLLKNIEAEAADAGYDLILPSRPHGSSQSDYIRSLQTRHIAGVLAVCSNPADPRIAALIHAPIPTVFIDHLGQGVHSTYVKPDYVDGARQVTQHLLQLGHRRIAFLLGRSTTLSGAERLLGCQQGLAMAGLAMNPGLLRECGWNTEDAYAAATALLDERRDFTAIVAGSDMMALGVLHALYEHGLCVPGDIAVTGFDDIDLCKYVTPPLTTVRLDRESIGRGAVRRLIAMIEGNGEVSPLLVPTQLIVRQSTGPVSSG